MLSVDEDRNESINQWIRLWTVNNNLEMAMMREHQKQTQFFRSACVSAHFFAFSISVYFQVLFTWLTFHWSRFEVLEINSTSKMNYFFWNEMDLRFDNAHNKVFIKKEEKNEWTVNKEEKCREIATESKYLPCLAKLIRFTYLSSIKTADLLPCSLI